MERNSSDCRNERPSSRYGSKKATADLEEEKVLQVAGKDVPVVNRVKRSAI